jgi:hypothetical protein
MGRTSRSGQIREREKELLFYYIEGKREARRSQWHGRERLDT